MYDRITPFSTSNAGPHKCTLAVRMQAVNLADSGTKGADLENIYYLRNTVDADALVKGIASAKAAGNKVTFLSTALRKPCCW